VLHFFSATTRCTIAVRAASQWWSCVARTKCNTLAFEKPERQKRICLQECHSAAATARSCAAHCTLAHFPAGGSKSDHCRVHTCFGKTEHPTHTSPSPSSGHPTHTATHWLEGVVPGLLASRPQQSVVRCGLQAVYDGLHTASG
jgi:hypothetical protein